MKNTNTENYTSEQIKKLIEAKDNYKVGMLNNKKLVKELKAENGRLRAENNKLKELIK